MEKPWAGSNKGCFSSWWHFWVRGNQLQKLKKFFFPIYVIFFKGSCTLLHCCYILRKLKRCLTWYFYSFYIHKLTSIQSKYELTDICILYTDPQLITLVTTLPRTTAAQKCFLYHLLMGLCFWSWNFHQHGQGFH